MILDDSGASGMESGVSERKPERNDERAVSLSACFEDCDEDDGSIDSGDDSPAMMIRAGRSECEADAGELEPSGGPLPFGDSSNCCFSLALIGAGVAEAAFNFWKAFASSSILDSGGCLSTLDRVSLVATAGSTSTTSCPSVASMLSISTSFLRRVDFLGVVSLDEVLAVVMDRVAVLLLDVVTAASPSCWFAAGSVLSLFLGRPRFLTTVSADMFGSSIQFRAVILYKILVQ